MYAALREERDRKGYQMVAATFLVAFLSYFLINFDALTKQLSERISKKLVCNIEKVLMSYCFIENMAPFWESKIRPPQKKYHL